MQLVKWNYLEDCTVFEVFNFSDFIFGFLTTHINNFTLPAGSARTLANRTEPVPNQAPNCWKKSTEP